MQENIGHYRIIRKLGHGGMGEVYLAHDGILSRLVAIKTLRQDAAADESALRRFRLEALSVSALNHPNIVVIHEIGQSDGLNYIVSEYVEGDTLRRKVGHVSGVIELLDIGIQIAGSLDAAHRKNIVHRDLKPENVIVRPDGYVKVLDFGLAKLSTVIQLSEETQSLMMTSPGVAVGTVYYMSPEQAQGKPLDGRSDIFSLGVMLYEIATGIRPFDADSYASTLVNLLTVDPAPLTTLAPDLPPELDEIVGKALRKKPDERYATAEEMAAAMRELRDELAFQTRLSQSGSTKTGVLQSSSKASLTIAAPGATAPEATPARISPPVFARAWRRAAWIGIAAALVAAVAAAWIYYGRSQTFSGGSVAVMPFVNSSHDVQHAYLSDGLTDSVIGNLSRIPSLRVSARSTVAAFAGKNLTPRQARQEFQVDAMLTGRVSLKGDSVSVGVELADTRNGAVIWNEIYERKLSELYSVERDMAREITERLKLQLSTGEKALLTTGSERAGAYEAYLKGRYQLNTVSLEGRRLALDLFRRAIDLDPNYAAAYSGLGDTYATLGYSTSSEDMIPRAREAAKKAIALDGTIAEPHATLAQVLERYDRDWAGAEAEYQRAMRLNPRLEGVYSSYALYCMRMRRWEEAISNAKKSVELEPHSFRSLANLGWIYYHHRDYDLAIQVIRRALAIDPDSAWGHHLLGGAYARNGRFREAIGENRLAASRSDDFVHLAGLAVAYAQSGDVAQARRELDRLLQASKSSYVTPYYFAWPYAALGDADRAFEFLQRAFEGHDEDLPYVAIEPAFDKLHADRRYKELLRKMRLPD